MANISINFSQEVVDTLILLEEQGGTETKGGISGAFDTLLFVDLAVSQQYTFYQWWNLEGPTLSVGYSDGALETFYGVQLSNPGASIGTALASAYQFDIPGLLSIATSGVLHYSYSMMDGNLTFEPSHAEITSHSVITKIHPTDIDYDQILGNVELVFEGDFVINSDNLVTGTLAVVSAKAENFLSSSTFEGLFQVTGNALQIGLGLGESTITGTLDRYIEEYKDGSFFILDTEGEGIYLADGKDVDLDFLSDMLNFPDDDNVSIRLPDHLPELFPISTGAGNDTFDLAGVYEKLRIDGGDGDDTVALTMFPNVYEVTQTASSQFTIQHLDTLMQVENIEYLEFGETFKTLLPISEFQTGRIHEQLERLTDLYIAFFGRAPEVSGLEYWQERLLEGGRDFATIAKDFAFSEEAQGLFPVGASNQDFVKNIYQNVFDRNPDQSGWDYWTARLDALGSTDLNDRGAFVAELILGAYATTSGESDRALLTNKHDVAMYYVNKLSLQPEEGFDNAINDLLELVTVDIETPDKAEDVIDYVFDHEITLLGVMSDQTSIDGLWSFGYEG